MDFLDQFPSAEDVGSLIIPKEESEARYNSQPTKLQKYAMNLEKEQNRSVDAASLREDARRNDVEYNPLLAQVQVTWRQVPVYRWKMAERVSFALRYEDHVDYDLLREVAVKTYWVTGNAKEFEAATGRKPDTWDIDHMEIEII